MMGKFPWLNGRSQADLCSCVTSNTGCDQEAELGEAAARFPALLDVRMYPSGSISFLCGISVLTRTKCSVEAASLIRIFIASLPCGLSEAS